MLDPGLATLPGAGLFFLSSFLSVSFSLPAMAFLFPSSISLSSP
ncbi:MAG: hypothetical protein PHY32_02265 [Candidatus Pacebacteria bacterium]|nr:hypothetical protein [Candidatus Paceibacterota bacterium]